MHFTAFWSFLRNQDYEQRSPWWERVNPEVAGFLTGFVLLPILIVLVLWVL